MLKIPAKLAGVSCAILTIGLYSGVSRAAFVSGIINVDFNAGTDTATAANNMSGPAVIGSAGDTWNIVAANNAQPATLVGANGSTVATSVTLDYQRNGNYGANGPYPASGTNSHLKPLFADFILSNSATPQAVTIHGLTPAQQYDLYVFSNFDSVNRATQFTLGSQSKTVLGTNAPTSLTTDGVAYGRLTGAADGLGNLTFTYVGLNAGSNNSGTPGGEGNLMGFQLTPVPEPASLGLAAGAAGLLLARRRSARRPA